MSSNPSRCSVIAFVFDRLAVCEWFTLVSWKPTLKVKTSFCNKRGVYENCHLYLLYHDLDDSSDRTGVKLANSQNRHPSSKCAVGFPLWVTLNAKQRARVARQGRVRISVAGNAEKAKT